MSRLPMKPVMASTFLRDSSASFARNKSFISANRFNELRDASPVGSRSRSPSTKRKSDNSYANVAKKSFPNVRGPQAAKVIVTKTVPCFISAESVELLEVNSAKVASICEKLHDSILAIPEENPVCPILRHFCEIFHIQNENSKIVTEALRKAVAVADNSTESDTMVSESDVESEAEPPSQMRSLGTIPKSRNRLFPPNNPDQPRDWAPARDSRSAVPRSRAASGSNDHSPSPSVTPSLQRFRDLVNNAEKSTAVFNLDMGRVPLINKATMGIKATAALTAMAAIAEKRPANNPSADTVAAIDDALSVAEKISFFGNSTKSASNGKSNSGSFCSIPVCYTFPDKETRSRVEHVFRSTCKASCATPYPLALRECMKVALEAGRKSRPDDFCSVSLDLAKLSLRIAWRVKNSSRWIRLDNPIPIPENVIEFPTKIPEGGVILSNLPPAFVREVSSPVPNSNRLSPPHPPPVAPPLP